jgi:indolepyruvate ferredoxin oxidoreductase
MLDPALYATREPQGMATPPDGVHIRAADTPMLQEERLRHVKLPRANAFARTNGIDRMVLDSADARFGIAVRGKAFTVLRQALVEAGISEDFARAQGLRIWKVGLAWPLDADAARAFAEGLPAMMM